MYIDPVDGGLAFALRMAGAEAGAVLLADNGELVVRAERMWGAPLLDSSRRLWMLAQAGADSPLFAPPVVAIPGIVSGQLVGLLCIAMPPHGKPVSLPDLLHFGRMLMTLATAAPEPEPSVGLALIRNAADPRAALVRLLEQHRYNITAVAEYLGCTRKTIYALARRYRVPLVPRNRP